MFDPILPILAKKRRVIAVDLHGHGRTPLGKRPIDLISIGNDLAVVLKKLGYPQVDVLGYSFGGAAAFRLAVQHPDMVRRLALVSAGYAQDGFYPEMLPMQSQVGAGMAEQMKGTPMYKSYVAVAPDPTEFPKLLDQMGELMRRPYDWSEDVKELTMPVMLVYGDSDMYRPEHIVKFYQLLGGGLQDAGWMREHMSPNRLAILPGLTHYEIFLSPTLTATVLPFLNDTMGKPTWGNKSIGSPGEPLGFTSSPNVTRRFCGTCGTPLTYQNRRGAEQLGHGDQGARTRPGPCSALAHGGWLCRIRFRTRAISGDRLRRGLVAAAGHPSGKTDPHQFCVREDRHRRQGRIRESGFAPALASLLTLKKQNPRLKVIVSVGGWEADGFSDAALTEASRNAFAQSAVELLRAHRADGIDLDWEYPGQGVAGIKYRPKTSRISRCC